MKRKWLLFLSVGAIIFITGRFFRYENLGHGYLLDRLTNTTVVYPDIERGPSFFSRLFDEWSTSNELRLEVSKLKSDLKITQQNYQQLEGYYQTVTNNYQQCKKLVESGSNPFVDIYRSGQMEKSLKLLEEKKNEQQE